MKGKTYLVRAPGMLQKRKEKRYCARNRRMISYTDFMYQIRSISFTTPHDSRLPPFLAEISTEEAKAGRGMMTTLVVRKDGDQRPGAGFFELAGGLVTMYPIPRSFGSRK
jgi:hypothetical protein